MRKTFICFACHLNIQILFQLSNTHLLECYLSPPLLFFAPSLKEGAFILQICKFVFIRPSLVRSHANLREKGSLFFCFLLTVLIAHYPVKYTGFPGSWVIGFSEIVFSKLHFASSLCFSLLLFVSGPWHHFCHQGTSISLSLSSFLATNFIIQAPVI